MACILPGLRVSESLRRMEPPAAHSGCVARTKELLLVEATENLGLFVTATESTSPESSRGLESGGDENGTRVSG